MNTLGSYMNSRLGALWAVIVHPSNRGQRLRALHRVLRWQVLKRRQEGVLELPWIQGLKVSGDRGTGELGRLLYFAGWPEPDLMGFLARLLRPGDSFADVGANIGLFSLLAATIVGPSGRVVAFEPDPESFRHLARNISLNGLSHVTAHQAAVGTAPGVLVMTTGKDTGTRALTADELARGECGRTVPVTRLDEATEPCQVVKVDAEGFEARVIHSMTGWRSADMPWVMVMEFVPRFMQRFGDSPEALLRTLGASAYELFEYRDAYVQLRPLRPGRHPRGSPGVAATLYAVREDRVGWALERLQRGPISAELRSRVSSKTANTPQ